MGRLSRLRRPLGGSPFFLASDALRPHPFGLRMVPGNARSPLLPLVLGATLLGACGSDATPSPFALDAGAPDGGGGAGGGGGGLATGTGGGPVDPTLGGPCVDDGDCNDGLLCTEDRCDLGIERCRFEANDALCDDLAYCNGVERCVAGQGCIPGEASPCSDNDACSIDSCDEATDLCSHVIRDADGDGDPDWHCFPGQDCDDSDPLRSSLVAEVCANTKDDDCDDLVDEAGCVTPSHDTCFDPLEITAPGSYALDTTGAVFDYATACPLANQALATDVVAAILLPPGPPLDVEITARTPWPGVSVAIAGTCGDPSSELACSGPYYSPLGGQLAKVRARGLGDPNADTAYPVYVATDYPIGVTLDVQFLPPTPKPTHETCGTAIPIVPGVPTVASILDPVKDLASNCAFSTGDLVYSFDLAAPANVDVYGASLDGDGLPWVSLRGPGCALLADEITCQTAVAPHLFWQSLPAGTYYVAVGATAPTDVSVSVELSAPSPPPLDENCTTAPSLAPNTTIDIDLAGHQDDINLGCFPGAPDASYALDLANSSDVLLALRIAQGDSGAVELANPGCTSADLLSCFAGAPSPLRTAKYAVAPGNYRVVAESFLGKPVQLTAFVRDTVAPFFVPFADGCGDVVDIPPTGGRFQGNTSNATADFSAGCDQAGGPANGAKEQLLRLVLPAQKRVVFDMGGSGYTTLLDVRKGPGCPGNEIVGGCTVGYYSGRSFLDLTLDAATYYVQIDGLGVESGPWQLDVYVVDP